MIKEINIKKYDVAKNVLDIQIPSYMVEAKIIDYYDIPPLKDTVETLQKSNELFYGYYLKEELCGVISIKINATELTIHRLIVHPNHFKKGIASSLLNSIESIESINTLNVSTGSKNIPAIKFYEKSGFSKFEEKVINNELSLSFFKKALNF